MMQPFGSIVHAFSMGKGIDQNVARVLLESEQAAEAQLASIGVTGERARDLIVKASDRFYETVNICESPIEKMMLAILSMTVMPKSECFPPAIHDLQSGEPWPYGPVVIVPQFVVARYRLDFLVCIDGERARRSLICIECDGAEHHHGHEDRQRDAERERYLKNFGIATLRYTGKTIHRLGHSLTDEIGNVIDHVLRAA
jgi:very-short-patch-repair endonuclease